MSEKNNPNKPSYFTGLHSYLYESQETRAEKAKKISEVESEPKGENLAESKEDEEPEN